jgi:hypothetical protein
MKCLYECGFEGTSAEVEDHMVYMSRFFVPDHELADQVLTSTVRQDDADE